MPIFEYVCTEPTCERFDKEFERFLHPRQMDDPNPECEACHGVTVKLVSSYNAPFTGDLGKYLDPKASMVNQEKTGHWQWRVKSSRNVDGSPERVFLDSVAAQRDFCKAEGLIMPNEINHNHDGGDGTQSSSRMRGSWF